MTDSTDITTQSGNEVMQAIGSLSATASDAAKAAAESGVDHEEVQGWLITIIKAIVDAFK